MANFTGRVVLSVAASFLMMQQATAQEGLLDWADYCKSIEADFKSNSETMISDLNAAKAKVKGWYDNPDTIPESALEYYRDVVQLAAFKEWQSTTTGQELIKVWKEVYPDTEIITLYMEKIYAKDVGPENEKILAQVLFKHDYDNHLSDELDSKISELVGAINEGKDAIDAECSEDVLSQVFRATIGRFLLTIQRNEEAAKRERGEIAKFVRYTTGISLGDIMKYGLRGGEGSELRKLQTTWTDALDNLGIGENHFLREAAQAFDLTDLNIPDEFKITIDGRSLSNFEKNINPFRWEWLK